VPDIRDGRGSRAHGGIGHWSKSQKGYQNSAKGLKSRYPCGEDDGPKGERIFSQKGGQMAAARREKSAERMACVGDLRGVNVFY